jgi:hypothetical protein
VIPRVTYTHMVVEVPPNDWTRAPDPLIHSWRWRQPEARFYVAFHEEVQAKVREFRAEFEREFAMYLDAR